MGHPQAKVRVSAKYEMDGCLTDVQYDVVMPNVVGLYLFLGAGTQDCAEILKQIIGKRLLITLETCDA